jgi:hypothetical protein
MPGGRPKLYKPEYVEQAAKLCLLGATDMQLADFFGVCEKTLNTWKLTYPEFLQSLKVTKEEADTAVERSLYRKALGYEFDSEKVFQFEGGVVRAPIREIVPPSDTACIFWLKNRKSKEWRDKQEVGFDPDQPLVVKHIGAKDA